MTVAMLLGEPTPGSRDPEGWRWIRLFLGRGGRAIPDGAGRLAGAIFADRRAAIRSQAATAPVKGALRRQMA